MERFLNVLKTHAAALDQTVGQPRFAIVTSVDPARYAARVRLQPEGVLSGWLPILSPWIGAGWGMFCPPAPGDQVLVLAQEGDGEHGVIVGACFSDRRRAPAGAVGEVVLVHASGSALRLGNDGAVHVTGDLRVSGEIFDRHGRLGNLRDAYNNHTHPGGSSGLPSPQD